MNWIYAFTKKAQKQFDALDSNLQSNIKKDVYEKLLVNPKIYLIPLVGDKSGFYKFRVGSYRLLCAKNGNEFSILVVKVKHRREAYS